MGAQSAAIRPSRLIALFALAMAVRLAYLFEWRHTTQFSVLVGDGRAYDLWARAIVAGDWLGSDVFYQAPLYPYFVSAVYALLGGSLAVLRAVQAALGAGACVGVALAGGRFFDARTGLLAGVLLALYAPAVYHDGLVQKPVLDGLLMSLLVATAGRLRSQPAARGFARLGCLLGLLALVRENALALVPLVAAWSWARARAPGFARREPAAVGWLLAGLLAVLAPVALRHAWIGAGGLLPTTSQAGPNFYIGNHAGADGRYQPLVAGRGDARYERHDATRLAERALRRALTPAEVSGYWFGRSVAWIRERPGDWLALLARKAFLTLHAQEIMDTDSIEAYAEDSRLLAALARVLHFGVLGPLALVGMWVTRRRWRELWLLHGLAGAWAGTTALFFVMGRYRQAWIPVLAPFAAAGVIELARCVAGRAWRRALAPGLLLLVAGAACNWPLAVPLDPRAITRYALAAELIDAGRLPEARAELGRVLALAPDFAEAHFRRGEIDSRTGDPAAAAAGYREALRLDPRHARAWIGLGSAALAAGDDDAALAAYGEALRIDPADPVARNNLAVALVRQGRLEAAADVLAEAIRSDPADPELRVNLARVLIARGARGLARDELEHALALDPSRADAAALLPTLDAAGPPAE